jgi:chromosome segregation ATPase
MSEKKTKKLKEKIEKEKKTIEKYNQQIEELKEKITESENAIEDFKQEIYRQLFDGMNLEEVEERAKVSLADDKKESESQEDHVQERIDEGRWM